MRWDRKLGQGPPGLLRSRVQGPVLAAQAVRLQETLAELHLSLAAL